MKFLRPVGSKRTEFDYHIHFLAFVSEQAAFGEQLRGDTVQESYLGRYRHLQREAVIHDSVGLDDAVAEHEALCLYSIRDFRHDE